jgi:hypothetical protein
MAIKNTKKSMIDGKVILRAFRIFWAGLRIWQNWYELLISLLSFVGGCHEKRNKYKRYVSYFVLAHLPVNNEIVHYTNNVMKNYVNITTSNQAKRCIIHLFILKSS